MNPVIAIACRRIVAGFIFFACSGAAIAQAGAEASEWPAVPSRLQLPTPYGTLNVATSEYVYESRLRVDDQDVAPKVSGILNIAYAFSMPKSLAALISINTGSYGCPFMYRWVILEKSSYKVSPEFGSCSEQIKVSAAGRKLTLTTPNTQKPDKIDIYVYDGKTIKHRTAATKP
jgi:hypothetical protein